MAAYKKHQTSELKPNDFLKLSIKLKDDNFAQHFIFVKQHRVREKCPEKPDNKTLFVLNVPPYYDEPSVKQLFQAYGEVNKVYFHSKPTSGPPPIQLSQFFPNISTEVKGFKVAYVVFKNPNSLKNVLKCEDGTALQADLKILELNTGLKKWCREYNERCAPNAAELQKEVDEYMAKYDETVAKEIEKAKESEGVPDAEGWITVTKHGKRPVIPRHEALDKKISRSEKKKRSQKELINFYAFQIRQTKMEHIAELRKKFEEDKKRIGLMKMTRKFKPY